MKVLVTGGAGYIGSHAVKALLAAGHQVVVMDNLFRGHHAAVVAAAGGSGSSRELPFEKIDILDTDAVAEVLTRHAIDVVMHFAGLTYVHESVEQPELYFRVNAEGSQSLLRAMESSGVKRIVFSSTCATYGEPEQVPITEQTPQHPISPYGQSKLMTEKMLADQASGDSDFAYAALRYFNVAGCAADGSLGEDHDPETHLIPLLLLTALGQRESFTIFGKDYPTPDGTCIRDYIHVQDLVDAHIRVAEALQPGEKRIYNLGIGQGQSVQEVLEAARRVTGVDFAVVTGDRRAGDPPQLYADATKIADELDWRAQVTDIDAIVESAWRWFKAHPDGYGD